jgi:hypothetical protein
MDRRTLDRVPRYDQRSLNYPIADRLGTEAIQSNVWTILPKKLDQGSNGACVGFGFSNAMICKPGKFLREVDNDFAHGIYQDAKRNDEWEGEDYDGTSVLAGAKVLKERGLIEEYRWAFGVDEVLSTLANVGPVVLGLNWYEGMFYPDESGYIRPTGDWAGGHCIVARGLSMKRERVMLKNSWGWGWGRWGGCFLTFDDLDKLLHDQGEACVPIKSAI